MRIIEESDSTVLYWREGVVIGGREIFFYDVFPDLGHIFYCGGMVYLFIPCFYFYLKLDL